ncbi:hypothetical protein KGF54_003293 [Candida jiufengensis]|uniref:uncharacterized protein n=1 Tax=Candida jiufengensis TaxID=497108 RepID=UPI0022245EA4|nr:uncharacterized protein KGF54_003293 [Candida jiufengensis]KAI5952426.1 hypothetical protein KGF54_003293 [Candida jiufengensis]
MSNLQSSPSAFDIYFININQLAYQFNKLIHLDNEFNNQLQNISAQSLELMNEYQSLHPSYKLMISYLSSQQQQQQQQQQITNTDNKLSEFNESWACKIIESFESSKSELDDDIAKYNSQNQGLKPEESAKLYTQIKSIVIKLIIQTNYQDAITYLNHYTNLVDFSNQPKTKEVFISNRYIEFLFLKYVINLFNLVWFPSSVSETNELSGDINASSSVSSSSFKTLTKLYNLSTTYHTKNIAWFNEQDDETKYYWLLKLFNLSIIFKQFQFVEFYNDFTTLLLSKNESSNYLITTFLQNQPLLKRNLMVMYSIVLVFVKPFNVLKSINIENEDIIDLFNEDPRSIEYKFYNAIINPLSKFDIIEVKTQLNNKLLNFEIISSIGYLLPTSSTTKVSNIFSFLEYLNKIIDFKNFLLVLSNIDRISKLQLLKLLGYNVDDTSPEYVENLNEITQMLITIMSALQLGKVGIKYLIAEEVFVNDSNDPKFDLEVAQNQEEIDELTTNLKSDSICALITNILTEKYSQIEESN